VSPEGAEEVVRSDFESDSDASASRGLNAEC
jgi:hypothetical protein